MIDDTTPKGENGTNRANTTHNAPAGPADTGVPDNPEAATVQGAASDTNALHERVVEALKTCFDPEIPVDIYELGLIYNVEVKPSGDVIITMTLTSPACPVAESLPLDVEKRVNAVDGVATVRVDLTWDPPWTPDRMSDVAKLELNL